MKKPVKVPKIIRDDLRKYVRRHPMYPAFAKAHDIISRQIRNAELVAFCEWLSYGHARRTIKRLLDRKELETIRHDLRALLGGGEASGYDRMRQAERQAEAKAVFA